MERVLRAPFTGSLTGVGTLASTDFTGDLDFGVDFVLSAGVRRAFFATGGLTASSAAGIRRVPRRVDLPLTSSFSSIGVATLGVVAAWARRVDLDLVDGISSGDTPVVGVLNNSGSKLSAESTAVFLFFGVRISREIPASPLLLRLMVLRLGLPWTIFLAGDRRDGVRVGLTAATTCAGDSASSSLKLLLT